MIQLFHGDCLDVLKDIPDNSIDMVLTDPPYGTTACKWDTVIPFEPMWNELKRITKDNGAICLFGSEPFSSALRMSNIKMFKYDWIWKKSMASGFVLSKYRPLNEIENISVFSNKTHNYFPQGLVGFNKKTNYPNTKGVNQLFNTQGKERVVRVQKYTNYPRNIISFKCEKGFHASQKPTALLEYLIKTYTLESETVLDFTMGSGSAGVACKNLNRKFIGIEKDETYFKIAQERIDNA